MLNFYNYYDKIHPELMKKLKDLEEKSSGNNNVLVIRPLSTKDTHELFDNFYAKGETVYYDDSKIEAEVTPSSNLQIEISEVLAYHILNDIDNIIFYFARDTGYEGLIYAKKRICRNIVQSVFYHTSRNITEFTPYYVSDITDTIVCGVINSSGDPKYIISKLGH